MSDTTLAGNTGGTPTESDRFLELKARAETLGWELLTEADDPSYHPWVYVLHRFGETTASCQWPSRSPRWWPGKSPRPVR